MARKNKKQKSKLINLKQISNNLDNDIVDDKSEIVVQKKRKKDNEWFHNQWLNENS